MTTANSHDAFCPLTQAWHVNYSITLSNYNHDAYTYLLELKSGWRQLITFENFFDEWRNEETLIGIICLSFILTNFSFTYLYMKNIVHFTSKVLRERSVSLFIAWEGGGGSLDFNLISFVFHFFICTPCDMKPADSLNESPRVNGVLDDVLRQFLKVSSMMTSSTFFGETISW